MEKQCTKCNRRLSLDNFYNEVRGKYGVKSVCKECTIKRVKIYDKTNRKQIYLKKKIKRQTEPWIHLYESINARCYNKNNSGYKYYGDKGILNTLSISDIKFLYFRDNADKMVKPNIHRINVNDNYSLKNCMFMEAREHSQFHKRNEGITKNNISGIKGVCWNSKIGKWRVQLCHNKVNKSLGYYTNIKDAISAYNNAVLESCGYDAYLNDLRICNKQG